jgi:putative hydrolase of the HAD superfamily
MNAIEVVFFDAGGTLVRPREDVGRVYARAAARQGLAADPEAVLAAFVEVFRRKKLDGRVQDRAWWREVVDGTFARIGRAPDPDALFEEVYAAFTDPASWVLADRARETLASLRARGYRTGLISNWDDRLPGILEGLGLAPLLDPVVVSFRVGAEKPDPRIYRTALAEARVPPHRALMVGDDDEADVAGAMAVGMRAVRLGGDRPGPDGTLVIHRLEELLGALTDGGAEAWRGPGGRGRPAWRPGSGR